MASALLPRISTALRDTEYCSVSSSSYSSSLELLGGSGGGVSEKRSLFKFESRRALVAGASLGNGTGGGVLDRPTIEKTTPGRESEFDLRKSRKTSPPYKVLLHNDNFNKREYVVQVLMKVIPGMTVDTAVNIMQEAHYNGMAVVIVCGQADAEEHCMQLRGNGLLSSIEPASGGC